MNKFNYLYVLQGDYGYGHWDDLTAAEKTFKGWKEVKADKKCYVENEGGRQRIIERRELNPEWVKWQEEKRLRFGEFEVEDPAS